MIFLRSSALVFLIFFGQVALAKEACSTIKMDVPGGSMEKIRTTDQGNLNICASMVLSQMYDAQMLSSASPDLAHRTSALANAVRSYQWDLNRSFTGSPEHHFFEFSEGLCYDFEEMQINGSCDTHQLDSGIFELAKKNVEQKERGGWLSGLSSWLSDGDINHIQKLRERLKAKKNECGVSSFSNIYDLAQHTIQIIKDKQPNLKPLVDVVDQFCPESEASRISLTCNSFGDRTNEPRLTLRNALAELHKRLERSEPKQPVAIGYCREVLESQDVNPSRFVFSNKSMRNCSKHWGLVIGRKKIGGQCHFLVRNSYGENACKDFAWPNCEEDGDVWIPEENFRHHNLFDVVTLEEAQ